MKLDTSGYIMYNQGPLDQGFHVEYSKDASIIMNT